MSCEGESVCLYCSDAPGTVYTQVYGGGEAFAVGCVVHVVGVLSIDPALAPLIYGDGEGGVGDTAAENRAHCPPPALVPRLHAITITALPHSNPLLPRSLTFPVQCQGRVHYLHCMLSSPHTQTLPESSLRGGVSLPAAPGL